ncbi:MAG: hypothetical protein GY711_13670 [bacterium]|nr:hypothetical protein [bacterium]
MSKSTPASPHARWSWLISQALLAAGLFGTWIVVTRPPWLFGAVITTVLGAGILWIAVSALAPSKADRTCPDCGEKGLERMNQGSTQGVVCTACGFRDAEESSFYMAEEEGPLEPIALAERRRRRALR